ncbi:unconventional prefoldin RPB5 interactor 1 [Latimeria chalumnae]|uniref:Protein phosphatase 1 regulatory subunit 19 n=1 Tax=Latimeria chalumnae TaxID=7897 RepID=H3A256_LATCH|nr:PREDICTED: unconventional prefoldin RPB5 interactor 1 [Latimeria chalumnae]|eukprot:XP_005997073.1 PREDICTED: unconventional prefoldin RPB5 interactor 1 [Latimeria chalumnae]
MDETTQVKPFRLKEVSRLREEQEKVVTGCQEKIQHWKKVENDYEELQKRLLTLPDKLSYDVMVPFGPFAFMPGELVHTNEVTVLLGDNWFAKCSAKQAVNLVEHRKKHVQMALDDLQKVVKSFESRMGFTEELQKLADEKGDIVDIREEIKNEDIFNKGRLRTAHKPHSKPKVRDVFEASVEDGIGDSGILSEAELWAKLEELERQEEMLDNTDRLSDTVNTIGEDTASSEEEKERKTVLNGSHEDYDLVTQGEYRNEKPSDSKLLVSCVNGTHQQHSDDDDDDDYYEGAGENSIPTIYFSHTVEPKRVRINTGKNTTLKFSEKKEEAKRKRRNSNGNGHSNPELPNIKTPADIYRLFVDVVNGELIPRKSILKSRSRENSVCSDTSESSTAEFDERRGVLRTLSHDESVYSDTGEGILEEEETPPGKVLSLLGAVEAFSGTVIEKEPVSPCLTIAHPVLPTIPERKAEEISSEAVESPKKVSKFKAARMQQKK